jgi:D,D-heptose 1,7-bisphosphate phosphatase
MDLVILAGGRGTRINKITRKIPKPIIKFKNISFLRHLINHYAKYNFNNIFILAGYKGYQIYKEFNNKHQNLVKIKCFIEKKRLDTAGALNLARNHIKSNFVLVNGDTFVNINFKGMTRKLNSHIGRIGLLKRKTNSDKLQNLNIKNNKIQFSEKGKFSNAGIYYFKKEIFRHIPKKKYSLEKDLLPNLIKKKLITGIKVNGFFIDIGTPKTLSKAKIIIPKIFEKPAVFIDRDGVINYDYGHVSKIKEFKLNFGIKKLLKNLNKKNFNIFIVTNQAGVAKNFYSENDFYILHKTIKEKFLAENIYINDIESCFHHPNAVIKKYRKKCKCRKPEIGMLLNLEKKWLINSKKSFFIGDQVSDQLCAQKYGVKFLFYKKGLKF